MAASAILAKYGTRTALTISLGSLASSTAGVGRQGTIVDNSTTRYPRIHVYAKVKLGTSPTSGRSAYLYLIRDDGSGTPLRTDGAGASDAALTVKNAVQVGALSSGPSAATGDVLLGDFVIDDPGPKWTLAVAHDTVAALDPTNGNHDIEWIGLSPEAQ